MAGVSRRLKASGIYKTLHEKWDLYIPFLERGHQLLRPGGQMAFIIPDAYNAAKYAVKSHEFFLTQSRVERLDFCSEIPLFKAGVNNTILHFAKSLPDDAHTPQRCRRWGEKAEDFEDNIQYLPSASQVQFGTTLFRPDRQSSAEDTTTFVMLEQICYITKGMVIHAEESEYQGEFGMKDVLSDTKDELHSKRFALGKDIMKWTLRGVRYLEWGTARAPAKFSRPTFPELHETKEKLVAVRTPGSVPKVIYDDKYLHFDASSVGFVPWHHLAGVVNRSITRPPSTATRTRPATAKNASGSRSSSTPSTCWRS